MHSRHGCKVLATQPDPVQCCCWCFHQGHVVKKKRTPCTGVRSEISAKEDTWKLRNVPSLHRVVHFGPDCRWCVFSATDDTGGLLACSSDVCRTTNIWFKHAHQGCFSLKEEVPQDQHALKEGKCHHLFTRPQLATVHSWKDNNWGRDSVLFTFCFEWSTASLVLKELVQA